MEEFNNETETLIYSFGGVYYKSKSLRRLYHIIIMCIISKAHHRKSNAKRLCTGQLTNNRLKKKRGKKN